MMITKRLGGKNPDFETIGDWINSLDSDEYTADDEAVLVVMPDGIDGIDWVPISPKEAKAIRVIRERIARAEGIE